MSVDGAETFPVSVDGTEQFLESRDHEQGTQVLQKMSSLGFDDFWIGIVTF